MRKIGLREILLSSATPGLKALKLGDHFLGPLAARLAPAQIPTQPPFNARRILVIRPGGIGDAVFLLPVFQAIKLKHPQARIDVLCQKRNAGVFSSQGHVVDHVFLYGSLSDLRKICKDHYDIIVDTEQWHYLTALTARCIKSPVKIGFATRPLRRRFFNFSVGYDSEAFELENFVSLFAGLTGDQGTGSHINDCFYLPQELMSWAGLQIPLDSVTISIGASTAERRLSVKQAVILANGLLRRGFHPVFLGGRDAQGQIERVIKELRPSQAYNFAGKITLPESAALIKTSRLFIGTDSGLMHLACAVDSPVIALFGPGNMKKWMPRKEGQISINKNAACSPCTAFGYGIPACRGSYHCLGEIDLEAVLEEHLPLRVKNG